MSRVTTLKKNYRDIVGEAKAIRDKYTNTADNMTEEEASAFDALMEKADRLWAEVEREERAEKSFKMVEEAEEHVHGSGDDTETKQRKVITLQKKAFDAFLVGGASDPDYVAKQVELKVLQADLDTSGGYLVAPQAFVQQLLKAVDDQVMIRQYATVYPLGANESLGVPSLDTDLNDADWTTELATGNQDDSTRFGKRELRPHPFAKRVKISNKLLRSALMDPEAHVRERLAYKFGITEEKAFMTGNGAEKPLGLFTASAQGISTGRDVTIGTTTAVTADGFIDVLHGLKPQYWGRSRWLMHRDVLKQVRKLKDGNGQYLWQAGLAGGTPNTILDRPYMISEFAPNTLTNGQYVALIGDFTFYWIVDALGLTVQRVVELYAESNATGFIGRAECDGMPVLEEAFSRGKLA